MLHDVPIEEHRSMYFSALAHPGKGSELRDLFVASRAAHPSASPTTILLPIDATAASEHAVQYVARNLSGLRARIHVLNVQRLIVDDSALLHAAEAMAAERRQAGERLAWKAARTLARASLDHSAEVAFGPVADTIARVAEARGCAVIVLGIRPRHPLAEALMGSVSRRLIRITRVPVLLVRHETRKESGECPRHPW